MRLPFYMIKKLTGFRRQHLVCTAFGHILALSIDGKLLGLSDQISRMVFISSGPRCTDLASEKSRQAVVNNVMLPNTLLKTYGLLIEQA